MKLFEELFAAASTKGLKPMSESGKTGDAYLIDMLVAVSQLSSDVWNGLSTTAQEWYNAAGTAANKRQPLPPLEGFHETPAATPELVKEKQKPVKTPKPQTQPVTKAVEEPPVVRKQRVFAKTGVIDAVRRTFIDHPDWTARQAHEELVKQFPQLALETVMVNAGDIRRVIALAREMGYWNEAKYTKKEEPVTSPVPDAGNPQQESAAD